VSLSLALSGTAGLTSYLLGDFLILNCQTNSFFEEYFEKLTNFCGNPNYPAWLISATKRHIPRLLVEDTDDKLFQSVLHKPEHTVYQMLPERRHDITYSLRPRRHDLMLSRITLHI